MCDKAEITPSFLGQELVGDVTRVLKEPSRMMSHDSYVLLVCDLGCKLLYAGKVARMLQDM